MFIFRVNLGMWPLKLIVSENEPCSECFNTHIYGISKEVDGKMFIFRVNLGMWSLKSMVSAKLSPVDVTPQIDWIRVSDPSNWSSQQNVPCSEGFNTHLWDFQEDRWENIHFESKPRHVTPQIDGLSKMSPVLSVSTHIYGFPRR